MPETSTIRDFVEAIRTRETASTKALKALWNARSLEPALAGALSTIELSPLDPQVRDALKRRGSVKDALVNHIDTWPSQEKIKARNAIVTALQSSPVREVKFYWDVNDDPNETKSITRVENLAGPGDIVITFRSPQQSVRVSSLLTVGAITTDVG